MKKTVLNKILARYGYLASFNCFFQELLSLDIGGLETFSAFISELSYWRCKLLKNDGRDVSETVSMLTLFFQFSVNTVKPNKLVINSKSRLT